MEVLLLIIVIVILLSIGKGSSRGGCRVKPRSNSPRPNIRPAPQKPIN